MSSGRYLQMSSGRYLQVSSGHHPKPLAPLAVCGSCSAASWQNGCLCAVLVRPVLHPSASVAVVRDWTQADGGDDGDGGDGGDRGGDASTAKVETLRLPPLLLPVSVDPSRQT